MSKIYWTKRKIVIENDIPVILDETELIKEESDFEFVPDGDGFEVNMNGIEYKDYIKAPEDYILEQGVLIKVK